MSRTMMIAATLLVASIANLANADEVATIVNGSQLNVELYLKWSNLPRESAKIVLRPGDSWSAKGPSGAKLEMRFNSTPGMNNPPAEVFVKVRTAEVTEGNGYVSTFKNKNPQVVVLTGE